MTKNAPRVGLAAVKRAKARVGTRLAAAGYCQMFTRECYGVPASGDFDGDRDADAVDAWKKARKHGRVVVTNNPRAIPRGAAVYWSGGRNGHGHAAVSLGEGRCVSTDAKGPRTVAVANIDDLTRSWGLNLLGYVLVDGNGWTLYRPAAPAPKAKPSRPRVRKALAGVRNALEGAKAKNTKKRLRQAEAALVAARDGK